MPTPAGNAPDPHPPASRNPHSSSCPDPDDVEQQPQQQEQLPQSPTSPASPSSASSQTLQDSQPSRSSSWRPESSSSQSQDPAANSASLRSMAMYTPLSTSAAAAMADGSGDYESLDERRSIRSSTVETTQTMDVDDDEDDHKDDEEDEDRRLSEDRRILASAMRRDYIGGDDHEGSDSDTFQATPEPPVITNVQEHLMGLIRRIDELNARDAERAAARATAGGEGSLHCAPSTSRRPPDALSDNWGLERAGGEGSSGGSSSSTRDDEPEASALGADTSMLGLGYEYADPRVIPVSPSTYLRPGSRFKGTQQSERQQYDVVVDIKHVDLRESFLCGYLRIRGLTDEHPTLTTYFEGEIIGTKYGFLTQHPSWGASEKTDLSHWAKFQAFRPFQKQMKKGGATNMNVSIKDVANRENIFMRWKEHFLVPDHRVRTIHGASFEGFYYICFNQLRGEVSGIYFHSKSEKFQQLELKHEPDKGCSGAVEFR